LMQRIDASLVNDVLPAVSLMGRMQSLSIGGIDWLIDVAHNPAAAEVLARTLASTKSTSEVIAIVGVLDDKDLDGIIVPLATLVDRWIAVTADSPRALPADELGRTVSNLTDKACLIAGSAAEAIEFARRCASESDKILVTGSFFTVGPILTQLTADSRP
jgi:dihydrofolate synthase/folylpolyglutamate synthase